jgi:hypothetical protein
MWYRVLDYQSPAGKTSPANQCVAVSTGIAFAITALINIMLLAWAYSDRSWNALAILMMIGPVVNVALALLSAIYSDRPTVGRWKFGHAVYSRRRGGSVGCNRHRFYLYSFNEPPWLLAWGKVFAQ